MITIINLSTEPQSIPGMSDLLVSRIQDTLARSERVLLFLNVRGDSRAYICRDCSYRFLC